MNADASAYPTLKHMPLSLKTGNHTIRIFLSNKRCQCIFPTRKTKHASFHSNCESTKKPRILRFFAFCTESTELYFIRNYLLSTYYGFWDILNQSMVYYFIRRIYLSAFPVKGECEDSDDCSAGAVCLDKDNDDTTGAVCHCDDTVSDEDTATHLCSEFTFTWSIGQWVYFHLKYWPVSL